MWLRVSISAWSPPQDAHKSIAPEKGVLAHLTLDCFFFVFLFFFCYFTFETQLLLHWRVATSTHCIHRTLHNDAECNSTLPHFGRSVSACACPACCCLVSNFPLREKKEKGRKLGKLKTILDCYNGLGLTLSFIRAFTYTIFLFLFFKISHLASMNLLLVVELVDCGGEETTIHGRPKIASYWLASIHLALGWDRRERGEENEGRMRIIRYGFGVRWGSSRELAWLRMRASFTGDEQSRVVGPIFALPCPACDISIENNWIKKRRQKKRNWRRMREISLSGNQQEQWEMRKE